MEWQRTDHFIGLIATQCTDCSVTLLGVNVCILCTDIAIAKCSEP